MDFSRSNIFFLAQAGEDGVDDGPLLLVFFKGAFAVLFEGIIFALAAGLGFGPAGFDEAAMLKAMEDGVKHAVGPLHLVLGAGLDLLDDGVAVAFAARKQGEDERFGGGGDKFFPYHGSNMHCMAMYVKKEIFAI